jgi:hypothetical protein
MFLFRIMRPPFNGKSLPGVSREACSHHSGVLPIKIQGASPSS